MRPLEKRSIVWNYFKKIDQQQSKCNLCNKILKSCGGTTNLKEHLKRLHPTQKLTVELPSESSESVEVVEIQGDQSTPTLRSDASTSTSVTLTNPVEGPSSLQRDHSSVSTSTSGASTSTTPVKVTVTTPIAGPSGLQKERSSSVSTSGASTASATTPKRNKKIVRLSSYCYMVLTFRMNCLKPEFQQLTGNW